MILSRRVALGGVQLDELDDMIVIRGADPGMARENVTAVNRMGGWGQRVTTAHWETLEASVTFAIDIPKREMERRKAVWDKVTAWAKAGKWLTFNWIPGRRLYVDKVVWPSAGDMWNWTDEYTITFRAYNIPFWQDDTAAQVTAEMFTGTGNRTITVGGNVRTVMDVSFRNRSGATVTRFSVSTPAASIELSGISLGGSETLKIFHGTDGFLRITAGSRDIYGSYRGSDDLFADPGDVRVTVSVPRAGDLTISAVGRWIG